VKNANDAYEKVEDIVCEQKNEVVLKFREKARCDNTDTLLTG
jgi:hypothetical protein